jgi:IS1 family transposase
LIFLLWTVGACLISTKIEFKTYVEELVPPEHESQVTKSLFNDKFFGAEDYARIYFVWGVDDIDKEDTSMWISSEIGEPVIDRNFDPIEKETFTKLMEFCTDLQSKSFVVPDSVDCWIQDLYDYTQKNGIKWVPSNKYAAQNYFLEWLKKSPSGQTARDLEKVGVVDGKITFM